MTRAGAVSKLKVLDLFSGIGGFSLGLERTGGFETVAFCEIEPFPRKVLAKHWPEVPCYEDVRKLKGADVGPVDVICGGYPCQPFSTAGKRAGAEDDRHLWPEFNRLVAELRPAWVIGENVAGHISMGLDDVLSDLEGQGYACRTFVIPACACGAPHQRYRCWTVAHAASVRRSESRNEKSGRQQGGTLDKKWSEQPGGACFSLANPSLGRCPSQNSGQDEFSGRAEAIGASEDVADAAGSRLQGIEFTGGGAESIRSRVLSEPAGNGCGKSGGAELERACSWLPEPSVGRVAHGVPQRVDRLKALGNAVVPQIPEMIGRAILAAETRPSIFGDRV